MKARMMTEDMDKIIAGTLIREQGDEARNEFQSKLIISFVRVFVKSVISLQQDSSNK